MNEMNHKLDVRLVGGSILSLSVFKNKLLFLHGEFISAQFELDKTGIGVHDNLSCAKIEFHTLQKGNESYQGWYAEPDQLEELITYFRMLGYKCEQYTKVRALDA